VATRTGTNEGDERKKAQGERRGERGEERKLKRERKRAGRSSNPGFASMSIVVALL
jgi:hypothetical protein